MIPALAKRLPELLPLARQVQRVRSAHPHRVPPGSALTAVQAASERLGGLPALAAEVAASYTLRPVHADLSIGGRVVERGSHDRETISSPAVDQRVATDMALVRLVLRMGLGLTPVKLRFLGDLVDSLGADVLVNTTPRAARNAVAMAAAFDALDAPGRLQVQVTPAGVVTRTVGDAVDLIEQAGHLLADGVVHGRLGAVAPTGTGWPTTTHWETGRRVSPVVREVLVAMLAASRNGDASRAVPAALRDLGVPDDTIEFDLDRLLGLLAPVADRWPTPSPRPPASASANVIAVDDHLGFMYGLADLLALRAHV